MQHDDWWKTKATKDDICDKALTVDDFLPLILPELAPAIKKGSNILDFGCGIGRLTIPVAKHFTQANLIGVDINQSFLEEAIGAAADGLVTDRCYFMPFLDTNIKVDAAFSVSVFQHMLNDTKKEYIHQIARALNKGGIFRFQYVEGEADSFLTHDATFLDISNWCAQADLEIAHVENDLIKPRWTWVTAVKE